MRPAQTLTGIGINPKLKNPDSVEIATILIGGALFLRMKRSGLCNKATSVTPLNKEIPV